MINAYCILFNVYCLLFLLDGQCDDEAGTRVVGGVEGDGASELLGEFTAQGKSEADALFEGVELDETPEDVLCFLGLSDRKSVV